MEFTITRQYQKQLHLLKKIATIKGKPDILHKDLPLRVRTFLSKTSSCEIEN